MDHVIRIHQTVGADVLQYENQEIPQPKPGEVLLRQTAIGLNFIDVYFRTGVYPAPQLPFIPGLEGAGIVESLGEGVTGLSLGDRVGYAAQPLGAYAQGRVIPAERVVRLPDEVDDRVAAAMMLKGMTAQYLLRSTVQLKSGDTILFHAAAGGVGLIVCQWAKHLGVNIIGTVGSEEKAQLAKSHGCTHTVRYNDEDFVERVNDITDGKGVDAVYDSVGKDTFDKSMDCLKKRGTLVLFGQSSGKVPSFDPAALSAKGSIYLTRPTLFHYTDTREDLVSCSSELFDALINGAVTPDINQEYPLADARQAHEDLEGRRTTGATILIP